MTERQYNREVPEVLRTSYYLDSGDSAVPGLFKGISFVWEAVAALQSGECVDRTARSLCAETGCSRGGAEVLGSVEVRVAHGAVIGPHVVISGDGGVVCVAEGAEVLPGTALSAAGHAIFIGRGARVGPNAHLDACKGSIIVGDNAILRQGSYIRELSVIGANATIGNSCEIKCAYIGQSAGLPHFNYVGDSILGRKSHLGAGAKISNLKITPDPEKSATVKVRYDNLVFDTGLRKFGAVLGDRVQLGCNAVANPGTLIGRNSIIYAGAGLVGFIPADTIVKLRQPIARDRLNPEFENQD